MKRLLAALIITPSFIFADGLTVENPMVPLAPPGAMAHAVFMTLTNTSDASRHLIGVTAEGYHMAHIHMSEVKDGIATMSSIDQLEIAPGQSIAFEPGGLHFMLMRPMEPKAEGSTVTLILEFANGESETVDAIVTKMMHGEG